MPLPIAPFTLVALCAFAPGAAPGQAPTGYADGTRIVRVEAGDQAQLDALLDLADGVMSERVGVGPVDLLVSPADIEALNAMGVEATVLVDDVPAMIRAERAQIDAWRGRHARDTFTPGDETYYETYHPLADLESHMAQLASARPDLCRTEVVGQSIEGRDITALIVSGPGDASNRPAVVWIGTQHAREWVSPMTVLYLAESLVAGYDTDARVRALMTGVEFWVVPVSNPDGYEYTWTTQRLWRKNRRVNEGGGRGVDLHRNWGVGWGGPGSESSPGGFTYHGAAPFSEPETAAIRDMSLALGPRLASFIDYHSYSQLILLPWGYQFLAAPEPDGSFFQSLGDDMEDAIRDTTGARYFAGPTAQILYQASGVSSDWYYGELGVPGFAIELRDTSTFLLPPDEILPCGRENLAAALLFAESTVGPFPTADLNDDGNFNNADINLFVAAFTAGDLAADITGDSILNNADINRFVQLFLAGV